MYDGIGRARGTDFFRIADQLTPEERDYWNRARRFVDDEVLPVINDYWERADFPVDLVRRLGALGLVGDGIAGYGCPPMSPIATGLVHLELNRGRRQPRHLPRRPGRARDAVDRHARLGGAEAALAAHDGHGRDDRRLRADRARPRVRLGQPGDDGPAGRRHLGPQRHQEVDRQRHRRRRRRGLGPRHRGRQGEGLPRRARHARLRRPPHRRQGLAPSGLAGRDHTVRRPLSPRRTGCPGRTASRTPRESWPAPGTPWPGVRSATPPRRTRSRCSTAPSAPSSESRWSASRSCRTSWSRCSPRSAPCSSTACASAGSSRRAA